MNNQTFSPYKITWAIIEPVKGKFFKKNLNELSKKIYSISKYSGSNYALAHFPSKERAIELINKAKASKSFKVTLITDKQFGLNKWNENPIKTATKKQLQNQIIIN